MRSAMSFIWGKVLSPRPLFGKETFLLIENCEHISVLHKELDRQFAVAIIDLFSVAPCMLWRQPVLFDPREYQNVRGPIACIASLCGANSTRAQLGRYS